MCVLNCLFMLWKLSVRKCSAISRYENLFYFLFLLVTHLYKRLLFTAPNTNNITKVIILKHYQDIEIFEIFIAFNLKSLLLLLLMTWHIVRLNAWIKIKLSKNKTKFTKNPLQTLRCITCLVGFYLLANTHHMLFILHSISL